MIHGAGDSAKRSDIEDSLKPWKSFIVTIDDGLRLRKKEAAVVIYSLTTFAVFLLWLYEPPFLALVSFTGIVSVLLEQLTPFLSDLIFGESQKTWTTSKCVRFREICTELAYHKNNFENLKTWLKTQKLERPVIYIVIVFSCLSVVSYASFRFSNLWLCYFMFLVVSLGRVLWYEWDLVTDLRNEVMPGMAAGKSSKKD